MPFPENNSICRVWSLMDCLARTALVGHGDAKSLFVGYTKPDKSMVLKTIGRWIKEIMVDANIDTLVFKQHTSASAAWLRSRTKALSLAQIYKTPQWSALTTTYKKLYP